jgi:5-methyltetrahydropteroyltriglutamate--homocysteine methyltransferase
MARPKRGIEDKAIAEAVKLQGSAGLHSITDGEFGRTYFHMDFLEQLGVVVTKAPTTIKKADDREAPRA